METVRKNLQLRTMTGGHDGSQISHTLCYREHTERCQYSCAFTQDLFLQQNKKNYLDDYQHYQNKLFCITEIVRKRWRVAALNLFNVKTLETSRGQEGKLPFHFQAKVLPFSLQTISSR